MARRDTRLYRDPSDRKIGGVCSGLARYFDVDTLLVRVAFVGLLVFGGGSLVVYLLLWLLLDPAPEGYWDRRVDGTPPVATPNATAPTATAPTATAEQDAA